MEVSRASQVHQTPHVGRPQMEPETMVIAAGGSAVLDRVPLLFNNDVGALLAQPQAEDEFFYRNGQGDEQQCRKRGEGDAQIKLRPTRFSTFSR